MNGMRSSLGKLRFFQSVMIAAIPLFGWVAESGSSHKSDHWTPWHWVATAVALYSVVGGFLVRRRLIHRSEVTMANDVLNPKVLKQWEAGNLVGMAMAESIAIWGVVLRMVFGGALWQAALFYATALFLLLLWTPRIPTITVST